MRPLRYGVNVTLDGCCDHRAGLVDEELHQFWTESIAEADALLYGRVTYQMMEEGWRSPPPDGWPAWLEPFAREMNAAKKYVVSTTLETVDWNTELIRGDLAETVRRLKREPGKGISTGGVALPLALTELGLIDSYDIVVTTRDGRQTAVGSWRPAGDEATGLSAATSIPREQIASIDIRVSGTDQPLAIQTL